MAPEETRPRYLTHQEVIGAMWIVLHSDECEECRVLLGRILNHVEEAAGGRA